MTRVHALAGRSRRNVGVRPGRGVGVVRRTAVVLATAAAVAVAGCAHDPAEIAGPGGATTPAEVRVPAERIAEILDGHRDRTSKLDRIHVVGAVEVEWPDAEGDWQSEQVAVRVWVDGRLRTAARFLIGFPETDLFWFGSDEQQAWLFDLASDETTLCAWRHDAVDRPACADAILPAIGRPLSTADLLFGVVPLPDDATERVRVAADGRTMSLVAMGRQEPVRLTWRIADGTLGTVEVLDIFGEPWARAEHTEPAPLPMDGLARMLQPRLASRVVVRDRDERLTARFNFDLANAPSLESQRWATLFDLGILRRVLRPDVVSIGDADPGGGGDGAAAAP